MSTTTRPSRISVFLGPDGAQYNLPQLYWKTIGDQVDEAFVHTYVFNRAYGRAILPTGAGLSEPEGEARSGASAVSRSRTGWPG